MPDERYVIDVLVILAFMYWSNVVVHLGNGTCAEDVQMTVSLICSSVLKHT